ncbi:unnamed protein product, partial [Meganyctiphanes norvegica]
FLFKDQHDTGTELYLTVPEEKTGIIIGRGGIVIKRIREESGAAIKQIISHDPRNEIFQIKGTLQQVDLARELLVQTVDGKDLTLHFTSETDHHDEGTEFYFTLPVERTGIIIGKGGTVIKSIREESGATIEQIKSYDHRDEIFKIKGTSNQVNLAKKMLEQTVDGTDLTLHFTSDMDQHIEETELYLTLPKENAGLIIGRGGIVIKSIREESGAAIDQIKSYDHRDETFQIKGTPRQVEIAKEMLEQTVDCEDINLQFTSYLDHHDDETELYLSVPVEKAGIIIGRGMVVLLVVLLIFKKNFF